MGAMRDKMENEMVLRDYSPRTQKTFVNLTRAAILFFYRIVLHLKNFGSTIAKQRVTFLRKKWENRN